MTYIKEKIDFIYQNILLFHFKTLSLRTLNERLKNTLHLLQLFLKNQPSFCFMYLFWSSQAYPDSFLISHFSFHNNVRMYTYAQARISLLFL